MSTQYLLLDGVLYDEALKRLYSRNEDLEIEPLYAGTPWQDVADLGPTLVKPGTRSALIREFENAGEWQTCASMLTSNAPMIEIAQHLRKLNRVKDVIGSESLLRYADPLVAWFWLNSYSPTGLRRILGPVNEWRMAAPCPSWLPRGDTNWHVFNSSVAAGVEPIERLTQAQMDGLERACKWQLKERLYTWLKANQPNDLARIASEYIEDWLNERLSRADAFGLTSERSIAIWCALSLCHGNEFAATDDGAYRLWLKDQDAKQLPTADQRLQQYYQESV
ncbi:DUF4123 domain-containing protein [Pseudomonas sp. NyZ704]|nr:DUF4123 domain-containing protein [Pseudomonas sp. NyZ704]